MAADPQIWRLGRLGRGAMRRQRHERAVDPGQPRDGGLSRISQRAHGLRGLRIRRFEHETDLPTLDLKRTHKVAADDVPAIRQGNPSKGLQNKVLGHGHGAHLIHGAPVDTPSGAELLPRLAPF